MPASIFNSANYTQKVFDSLKSLARESKGEKDYFDGVKKYFKDSISDIVLYDLFINIQQYARFNTTGTQYIFFHELYKKNEDSAPESYPVFFIEIKDNFL